MKYQKLLWIACLCFTIPILSLSQTSWKGTTSTSWFTASNWTAGVPTSTIDAIVGDANFTGVNQPTISNTATCKSLTIGGTRATTLTVSRTTTVSENILINANGTLVHTGSSLTVKGHWINNGTYSATGTGSNVIFAGVSQNLQGTVVTNFRKLTINAGSVTMLHTNVTVNGSSSRCTVKGTLDPNESPTYKLTGTTFNVNANAVIRVKGAAFTDNYANSGTVTLASNSVVDYAATTINQTVSSAYTYSTLTISGAGIKSLAANLPALRSAAKSNGNINVNAGTLDLGAFTANRGTSTSGGSFTVAAGAYLKIGGTNTFPANYATVTLNLTSTVEYSGTNQAVSARTYGNLILGSSLGAVTKTMPATALQVKGDFTSHTGSGTSVAYTAASNITISGQTSIGSSTTFNGGTFAHEMEGNWTNNGTFTGATSTISFTGAGSVINGSGTNNFHNLSITGNNITSNSNIQVSGNFSTTTPGSFTHLAGNTVTMSGASKTVSGTGIILENLSVTGTVSSTSDLAINGNLSVSGSWNSSGPITLTGTAKTISGAGTIVFGSLQATGSISASSNFTVSQSLDVSGTFSATAGTATFTGSSSLNGTANLFNVTINGSSLMLSASSVLGIAGGLTITAGTLDVSSNKPNTVAFNGAGAQTVNAITYHHLNLSNGNTKTAASAITVNGNLVIGSSTTFSGSSYTHSLLGNWINNGTFNAGTCTVQFSGSANATITGATTFYTLTINKSAASIVSLLSNISVPVINMTSASMLTGSNTLTITSARNGNGIILGTITRTHSFTTGINYAFEGPDNTINFTSVSGVSSITVRVTLGNISDFPNGAAINREYLITVPAGSYVAKLRLHYEDAELNGNDEAAMQLVRNAGANWTTSGKTGNSTTSNYVEQSSLSNITNRWTCASSAGVVSWNGSTSSAWNNAANWSIVSGTPTMPPGVNDIVQIGVSGFNHQPVIGSAVAVKSISMGSAKAAILTIGSGGSLTTSGNISGTWLANATHSIEVGNQAMTVGGDMILSDGTSGHVINLNAAAATISMNGSLIQTGNAAINFTGNTNLSIKKDFNYTNGTFNGGAGTVTYNGTASQLVAAVGYHHLSVSKTGGIAVANAAWTANGNLVVSAGELEQNANATINGNLTISTGAVLNAASSNITTGGNWSNSGTFGAGTGTVVLNGNSAQTISGTTFNNLSINKPAGTASLSGNITINNSLSILSGTLDLGSYTANRSATGGQLTIANGATLLVGGTNNFPQQFASNTLGSSSNTHYNGAATQSVAAVSYGNLLFSNGAGNTKSLAGNATINGSITINSGASFGGGAHTISLWGNWTNNGTFIPVTSTVVLNGTSKSINGNTTFNRITVNGSYSVQNNSDITYNGLLFVTAAGSYTAGGGTATVNGDLTNSGVLTSTGTTTFTGTTVQTIRLINAIVSTSTGVVNFNGTVSPVMNSTSTPTFANLNINNTGGVNPSRDWLILGSMTIAAGATFNGGISSHTVRGNFTNNGTLTSEGTVNFEPTYMPVAIKLSGTAFSSEGTINFGGNQAITITGSPSSLNDVRITNSYAGGISPASGWNIGGDLVINSNARFNAGNYTYTVAGDIESNGTLEGDNSTFTMSSSAGQLTGSPNTNFNHFTITGAISTNSDFNVAGNFTNNGTYDGTFGTLIMNGSNAAAIGGTTTPSTISQLTIAKTNNAVVSVAGNVSELFMLMIQSGTLFTSTYALTQDAAGGLLLISDGATLRLGGSNSLPGFSAYGLDVNSTVDYAGTNQVIGNAAAYGNLIISTAGTKTGFVPLIVQNNFTLSAGTFSSGITVTHSIGGNWTMTGGTYLNASSTILFNGTGNQQISSTGAFNNLTVNKSSGLLSLASNVSVNAILNLAAGRISLGNYNLAMGNSGTISNASASNYIIATGSGTLNQQVTAGGNKLFPVGLTSAYTPATIAFTAGSTTDVMSVRMLTSPLHGGLSGDPATSYAVNATWLISEAVIGGSVASISLQWPQSLELSGFNRALSRLAHHTNGAWDFGTADIAATGSNPYSVTRSGFTSFSPFAVSTYMALPVSWVSIAGRNENSNNIISWTVASELNNDRYEIEMSTTGNNFTAIGTVSGAGTTDIEQRYSFVHRNVSEPLYYYRVRQIDIDGKFSYSKIVRVATDQSGLSRSAITLLNNPVHDNLAISLYAGRAFPASLAIADGAGKIVHSQKLKLEAGNNVIDLGSFRHPAGIYYMIFMNENGRKEVVKFVKR